MTKQKSLKLNFVMNVILSMTSFIFPLITFPYVSRILLPIGTGKVSFATSLISYFSMFAQLGIPVYGIRACAKVRDDREKLTRIVQELLIINLVMDVISYALLILTLIFVPRLYDDRTLYAIVSLTIVLTSIGMEWLYKALEQYTYITIRSIVFKFVALVVMFLLIHTQKDYVIYGGITILAASASNVMNFINVHRYIDFKPAGKYNFRQHFKPVVTFFAMSCASTIYLHMDTVMLGFMSTEADVGYYDAAVKIRKVLLSIVTSLGAVLLPRASYYVEHGLMDEFRKITRKAFSFVFIIACPMTIYFMIYAKESVFLLSGEAYEGAILPMQIIMPTLFLVGISNITGMQILVPMGKENLVLYSEIAGAVVDVIINVILIPKFASVGVAIGTLVAEVIVLIVQVCGLRNEVKDSFKQVQYLKISIAIIFGVLASFWVTYLHISPFLTLAISSVLFFGVYGFVLLCSREKLVVEIADQGVSIFKKKCNSLKK